MNNKMRVIFTLSLVVNIFLIGFIGGNAYRSQMHKRMWNESGNNEKLQLSSDTRALVKESLKGDRKFKREMFKQAQKKKRALIEAFIAPSFDAKAYDRAGAELLEVSEQISKHRLDKFKELAMKLPQEERLSLSKVVAAKIFGSGGKVMHRPRNSRKNH